MGKRSELRWTGVSTGRLYVWRLNENDRYYLLLPHEVADLLSSERG